MEGLQFFYEGRFVDANDTFGVRMGNSFLSNLLAPRPIKQIIVNKSRMQHGERVINNGTKYDSRNVSLPFILQGTENTSYEESKSCFCNFLESGEVILMRVEGVNDDVYRFVYEGSTSYAENIGRSIGSMVVRFKEPNPNNREQL